MFAAEDSNWKKTNFDEKCGNTTPICETDYRSTKTVNWLYLGLDEWTITSITDHSKAAFNIHNSYNNGSISGCVGGREISDNTFAVRPVFYLESNIQYSSGSGEVNNPYRLIVES